MGGGGGGSTHGDRSGRYMPGGWGGGRIGVGGGVLEENRGGQAAHQHACADSRPTISCHDHLEAERRAAF